MGETSHDARDLRVLITDGGQMQPPEQEDPDDVEITREGDEEESGEDTEEEGGEEEAEDTEGEEEETEEEEAEDAEQSGEEEDAAEEAEPEGEEEEEEEAEQADTNILELELDGLYLDLLGLEVDLDEIELEITASPGEGNLLGNLLSAVSGLLDSPGMADGLGDMMPSLPSLSPMQRARELASAIANRIRSIPQQVGERLVAAIPFEQLLSQFFEALVDQLLSDEPENGGEEAEAQAA